MYPVQAQFFLDDGEQLLLELLEAENLLEHGRAAMRFRLLPYPIGYKGLA